MLERARLRKVFRDGVMSLISLMELRKLKMSEINQIFRTIAGSDIISDALQKEAGMITSILDQMTVLYVDLCMYVCIYIYISIYIYI